MFVGLLAVTVLLGEIEPIQVASDSSRTMAPTV